MNDQIHMRHKRKTPKKKWLRRWIKQLDKELEVAERRTLKNTYIISHSATRFHGDIPTSQMYMVDVFIVQLMIGLVLIGYAAAIVIAVVAATS